MNDMTDEMRTTIKTTSLWLALCAFPFMRGRADIRLTVDVAGKTASTVAVVYRNTVVEIPLDSCGRGSHTFRHIGAVHAALFYGMDSRNIFLEDGDSIRVSFDGADFRQTVKFEAEGGKEKIFRYLNQVSLPEVPEEKMALPFGEYAAAVDGKEKAAERILKAWKLDEVSPRFVAVEAGRIRYAYASLLMMYAVGHPFVARDTAYRPDEAYYGKIKEYAVEDGSLAELKEYLEYMKEVARMFGCGKGGASRKPVGRSAAAGDIGGGAKTPYERTVCMMNYVADSIGNDTVRQALLNALAVEQVEQYGIDGIDELLNLHATYVTDTVLAAVFKEKYDAWDLARPGRPSPDFRAEDVDDKVYTLSDFRGKYVYIDLWATWCGPCRREAPFLKELEEEYRGRNVTFLGLSTDARKADWMEAVKGGETAGVQLYLGAGSRFQKAYKADGIPHFILLDPEGKIVNANMLRPSSPDIRNYLDGRRGL